MLPAVYCHWFALQYFFFLSTFWGSGEIWPFQKYQIKRRNTLYFVVMFSQVAMPFWAVAQSELCSVWVKVVSFKKKKICFVFFFLPYFVCSLGWTLHQCYSKYRSFSSEAISRVFGSSEDKTSPQIRRWRATGKNLSASPPPPHLPPPSPQLIFPFSSCLLTCQVYQYNSWFCFSKISSGLGNR